ncbi:hypothetical protein F5148DRAFT_875245 [Russula earlei]|uniref:Uncharacterized protein n=1 Tax=Russula earlei TaxID=71964 RepID=A0ACC0UBY5_9AGAM|nr:hypothetical protein F5148DRAFT_875245 [Russula earlei]
MDSSQSPQASSSNALQRGKACLTCRRRKMKCDGIRPVCGPCGRANRPDDCEYTDGQNRTRTQMLEDTIAQLETRIQELEHPNSTPPLVILHDPHSAFYQAQRSVIPTPSEELSPLVILSSAEFPHASHSSTSSSPLTIQTPRSSSSIEWIAPDDPPAHVVQELLDVFFKHAPSLHFFLHSARFQHSMSLPPGNPGRPMPALVNAVYLWGVILSRNNDLLKHESILASCVASQLGSAIPITPSQQILQVIQAKILLIGYCFSIGHFLAARHEGNSAASLAVACGLHKIRTAQPMPAFTSFIDQVDFTLPEPQDQIEEGERINAFWAVFFMDRCLAVVLGPPLVISDTDAPGVQIDTPWPLEMETYERGQIYPNLRTSGTLRSFFSGMNNGWPWENHNPLTQLSKATALFERATRLAATWRPEIQNIGLFYSDFVALDQRIDEFKSQLMRIDPVPSLHGPLVHLACCLANGATIQLHATFSSQNTGSRTKCLSAAMAIVRANHATHIQDFTYCSPLLGSLWSAGGRVIINEIKSRRSFHAEQSPLPQQRDTELHNALEQVQSLLAGPAPRCAVMSYYLGRLQQESTGI